MSIDERRMDAANAAWRLAELIGNLPTNLLAAADEAARPASWPFTLGKPSAFIGVREMERCRETVRLFLDCHRELGSSEDFCNNVDGIIAKARKAEALADREELQPDAARNPELLGEVRRSSDWLTALAERLGPRTPAPVEAAIVAQPYARKFYPSFRQLAYIVDRTTDLVRDVRDAGMVEGMKRGEPLDALILTEPLGVLCNALNPRRQPLSQGLRSHALGWPDVARIGRGLAGIAERCVEVVRLWNVEPLWESAAVVSTFGPGEVMAQLPSSLIEDMETRARHLRDAISANAALVVDCALRLGREARDYLVRVVVDAGDGPVVPESARVELGHYLDGMVTAYYDAMLLDAPQLRAGIAMIFEGLDVDYGRWRTLMDQVAPQGSRAALWNHTLTDRANRPLKVAVLRKGLELATHIAADAGARAAVATDDKPNRRGSPSKKRGERTQQLTARDKEILLAVQECNRNMSQAAKELGISKQRVSDVVGKSRRLLKSGTTGRATKSVRADQKLPDGGVSDTPGESDKGTGRKLRGRERS